MITGWQGKGKKADPSFFFPLSFSQFQSPSSSPCPPGGLCLDRIEFSRANMGKALSRLCMANVSVERVMSLAPPPPSLASGSQSADLCCWGDLVFHEGYLKSTDTSCSLSLSLFSTLSLFFHCLVHWLSYNHTTYPSPIPLHCSLAPFPHPPSCQSVFFSALSCLDVYCCIYSPYCISPWVQNLCTSSARGYGQF